ncbi:DEAD/DEAH box helicase [Pelagibius sp. Alg239-R121]|uniref:DEAD/DEAH box helicase n=1 Tax=Pelagibius sp. Alg239-R121 TaxID=2993448 RepID=UPI0024A76DF9|nr:DEAD/DEAH box helicase [Pelagibius sp. Alg239-R121]
MRKPRELAFQNLRDCDPDDTVVVSFSGHGSETHELVTHDAQLDDLTRTAIPLDELTEWFTRIPAKHLVLFLDCCFSGGAGAKVLQVDMVSKSVKSVDAKLGALSGEGRIILTASSATEPAWESHKYGHGFFTHVLIEALQGPEEIAQGGRLPIYPLLQYVTDRVIDFAQKIGRSQNPTLRGTINGALDWPVFKAGPRYLQAFPDRSNAKATADVNSLAAFGLPQPLLEALATAIPSLNQLQIDAVNEFGVLNSEHLVVSAPTSSGKTMIGELAALRSLIDRKRALFLLPLKALVADKARHLENVYASFGVRTIEATGETDDISDLLRGQYDIALLTYEKFTAIALSFPHVLEQVGVVVVDETQMLADPTRGANLESLLTLIRMRRREVDLSRFCAAPSTRSSHFPFERDRAFPAEG